MGCVLEVGVEAILVLVFFLEVEVGDGHVGGGSVSTADDERLCGCWGGVRQVGEAGCNWGTEEAEGCRNKSTLEMPSAGPSIGSRIQFSRDRHSCAVIAFGPATGSFLELANSAPTGG